MSWQAPPGAQAQRRRRRQGLALVAVLALALHAALLGGVDALSIGADRPAGTPSVAVRTLPPPAAENVAAVEPAAAEPVALPPPVSVRPRPQPRAAREPALPQARATTVDRVADAAPDEAAASAPLPQASAPPPQASAPAEAAAITVAAASAPAPPRDSASAAAISTSASASLSASASASAPASPLAPGDEPPPTYRPQLPPAVTLVYEVRRGFLRGTGEIRWQPQGEAYSLTLQARIAGLTLLTQTSQGAIDGSGLVPERFVDQRARRSAQAANFRRDSATITYSGPSTQWALLAGSQDRLSWMIQLAGIAAAEPQLLREGGRVSMVVVGARGDASLWLLRYAGQETVETASGAVQAVKLVRDGRSVSDSSAEIWLDPGNHYLPAHATLRNSAGESEYDLLLEHAEPGG